MTGANTAIRRLAGAAATVVLLGSLHLGGPAPAAAEAEHAVDADALVASTVAFPIGRHVSRLAVDPVTDRIFLAVADGVLVRNPDGTALAKVPLAGVEDLVATNRTILVLADGGTHLRRLDPETLELTYDADGVPDGDPHHRLQAHDDDVWLRPHQEGGRWYGWVNLADFVRSSCGQPGHGDYGTTTPFRTTATSDDSGGAVLGFASNLGWWRTKDFGDPCPLTFASRYDVPGSVHDVGIADDGTEVYLASSDVDGAQSLTRPADPSAPFVPTGTVYATAGGPATAIASPRSVGGLLAVGSTGAADVYRVDDPTSSVHVPLPLGASGELGEDDLQLSHDEERLYAVGGGEGPSTFVVVHLTERVGDAAPNVVGIAGGARIVVPALDSAGASVTVGGIPVTPDVTPTGLAFTAPGLDSGRHDVEVTLDGTTTSSAILAVDLGPFGSVPSFLTRQHHDVQGTTPSAADLLEAHDRLGTGVPAGDLIAPLVQARPLTSADAQVIRLYHAAFLRPPDTGGLTSWVAARGRGVRLSTIAQRFVRSSEFTRTYGGLSNVDFVDLVYRNVLGRAPDARGLAHWTTKLALGTSRGSVLTQFSESSEHVRTTTTDLERIRLWVAMLRRTPSAAALAAVPDAERLGELAWSFLDSPDYPR